jgi:hypothetical protein
MTEAEWWECDDPRALLQFLHEHCARTGGKVSQRKLRLFLLACYQELWGNLTGTANRVALDLVEQLAQANLQEIPLRVVRIPTAQAVLDCGASEPLEALWAVRKDGVEEPVAVGAVNSNLASLLERLACQQDLGWPLGAWLIEWLGREGLALWWQADLFRDVFRGPFGPLFFRSDWRARNGGLAVRLAEMVYNDRAFHDLPILADALLDAGCEDTELLDHLRSPGPHVRGCWPVDALLGRD